MTTRTTGYEWLGFDVEGLQEALPRVGERVEQLFERLPVDGTIDVPGLDWSVGEVATHLTAVASLYSRYLSGERHLGYDLLDVAGSNERLNDQLGRTAPTSLRAQLHDALDRAVQAAARPALDLAPWHQGEVPVASLAGLLLGELLVHGQDLARALDQPWTIAADAIHVARAGIAVSPRVVVRDLAAARPATYRVRIGGIPEAIWGFDHEGLTITPTTGDHEGADCTLRTDAETMVLIAFGRISPLRAALRGRALATGRRPWLGLRLPAYIRLS